MKCEHINVHLNNTVFCAGSEEVLLVPNNLVTKVTMTKKTLQSYYTISQIMCAGRN